MSEIKRWTHAVEWEGLQISASYMAISDGGEYVMHSDYAALEAECASLKNSLLEITTRHFTEGWKQPSKDSELEQYLSAGIAQLEEERDSFQRTGIRAMEERDVALAECERLRKALERIADTDPDDGTAWFHEVAGAALSAKP